jgi:predicted NBD/HSP70 family sugar kinase
MAARINSMSIRRVNRFRIFHALREHPCVSQTELQRVTGLDKATTSKVVAQFLEEGLLMRGESAYVDRRVGRPETALCISPAAGILVGARLEPRKIRLITTDLAGSALRRLDVSGSTNIHEAIALFHQGLARIIRESAPELTVRGIGVGVPGLMDRAGCLQLAPNLGWSGPIQPLLQEGLDAPVYVDNDANAAAIAERLFGACQGCENFVYLSCHSGIGGGLFLGGRLYRGTQGFSGEIGHVTVVPGGRSCGCGKRGCLETYASEAGILRTLVERGQSFDDLVGVAEAAGRGEATVLETLDQVGQSLGLALSSLVNILNPEMMVLGGTLANVFRFLQDGLHRTLDANVMALHRAGLRVILSPLGSEVVPMGGIALAMDGFLSAPRLDISLRPASV